MSGASAPDGEIGYVLRSFPRLSQTFVVNEMLALERLGLPLRVFAITDPREALVQPQVADLGAQVHYLDQATSGRLGRALLAHVWLAARNPRRYASTVQDLRRQREHDRGYHVGTRLDCFRWAVELLVQARQAQGRTGRPLRHLHAHFAHDPTLTAMLASRLSGVPFSFTTHARDLVLLDPEALATRVAGAQRVVTCCGANVRHLQRTVAGISPGKIAVVPYGVDLERFRAEPLRRALDRGTREIRLVAVGRLVEKKGFADLIAAVHGLVRQGHRLACDVYGEGHHEHALRMQIAARHLGEIVRLKGALTHREIPEILGEADIFALTPVVTENGDRDAVPNALLEAMACGLPVVTTAVGGIPEAVDHGASGLVVAPGDATAIARAIGTLLASPALRCRLGRAARATVEARFDLASNMCRQAQVVAG